jgi:hypothetical protein
MSASVALDFLETRRIAEVKILLSRMQQYSSKVLKSMTFVDEMKST